MAKTAMDKTAKDDKKKVNRVVKGIDSTPVMYCNHVDLAASTWDLRIRLGQLEDVMDGQLIIQNLATVYMSPAHARAFANLLQEKLADYEKIWGQAGGKA